MEVIFNDEFTDNGDKNNIVQRFNSISEGNNQNKNKDCIIF